MQLLQLNATRIKNCVIIQMRYNSNKNRNFDTKLRFCFFARKARNIGIFVKRKVSV